MNAATTELGVGSTTGTGGAIPFLDDRYELGAELGCGSFASVYSAYDTVLGIDVAVKVLHVRHVRSPEIVALFTHEAAIASRMISPHAVKVHGLAVTRGGAPCIVYERLEGETLATRIAREGSLGLAETTDIVRQVSRALSRAHSLGVVHRDVKPDNIFLAVQPDGRSFVKLLDFGISEKVGPGGKVSERLVGTPEYIAPEVLFGSHMPDARSDLYSLAVVAFECLTGRCPIPGDCIDDVILRAARGERLSLLEQRPDLSGELDEWMDRALHPDPYWRFATAKEMTEALDDAARASRPSHITLRRAA